MLNSILAHHKKQVLTLNIELMWQIMCKHGFGFNVGFPGLIIKKVNFTGLLSK